MNELHRPAASRPRPFFAERLDALRRDLATVARDLLGRAPVPVTVREPLARHRMSVPRPSGDLLSHRTLVIERVVPETPGAVSLHLVDPNGGPLSFEPGQFLTVAVTLPNGQHLKRAYSLSVVPGKGEASSRGRITIKRVGGGAVSNYLNEHARAGDALTVFGPAGQFGVSAEEARGAHLLLIGGGSGITPLRSILEARLADPSVTVTLLFGNRAEADILFRDEIDALAAAHPERLQVRYVLESPPSDFAGATGRLDTPTAAAEISRILGSSAVAGRTTFALVCGPTPMMDAVRQALLGLGFPKDRIREEQFSSPDQRKPRALPTLPQPVTITVRGQKADTIASPGQTLLEAGLSVGLAMPFSCTMGGCGACKATLRSGHVVAEEPNCLTADEVSRGTILPCVSRAAEPVTLEIA